MYLVTGGAGFIGSHLVRELLRRGERVRVLDIADSERLSDVLADIEWVTGDVRDPATVRAACAGAEVVLHQAAAASVPQSIAKPSMTHDVNITGTVNILTAARDGGVRRVVFASSAAVYGNHPASPKAETLPAVPLSPYGVQKLASESYCRIWPALYGLETVALRYFNVFGPAQDPNSDYAAVIPRFITTVLAGGAPTVFGDGEQTRDFIYVQNVVDINFLASVVPAANGRVMNVGTGVSVTLNHLLAEIGRIVERPLTIDYQPGRAGDVRESLADISLLRATLDYTPAISFADGLAATVAAYRQLG